MTPRPDTGKRWTCLACGAPIRRAVDPPLGSPFYAHVVGDLDADHDAVRAPE